MTAVKEKIMDAVTIMSDSDAEQFWELISKKYPSWNDIQEVPPDEIDLQMLREIENDPECRQFTKESDIDWS